MHHVPVIRALAILGVATLLGCACQNQVACTAEARTSLLVRVVDAAGTEVCDAVVTARDGSFSARLSASPHGGCTYSGITERKGTYDIAVRRGDRRATLHDVEVTADECHVHTRSVIVRLPG